MAVSCLALSTQCSVLLVAALSKKSIITCKTTRFSSRLGTTIMLSMETRLRRQEGNAKGPGKRSVFERLEH
jgi:hypothetical protein